MEISLERKEIHDRRKKARNLSSLNPPLLLASIHSTRKPKMRPPRPKPSSQFLHRVLHSYDLPKLRPPSMKQVYLQAGIPLAISVAGLALARIVSWRAVSVSPESETQFDGDSEVDDDELGFQDLRERIEEMQSREVEMELRFLRYRIAKQQELELMAARSELAIESTRAEFMAREVEFLEAEKQRFEGLVEQCWRIVQRLELANLGNELLERKVGAMEAEVLRCLEEKEKWDGVIEKLEEEVDDLQSLVDRLRAEKDELVLKLQSSASSSLKVEALQNDYDRLANELEQARRDQVAEITEVTYLRCTNACLRHELMRNYQQGQQQQEIEIGREHCNGHEIENEVGIVASSSIDHHHHHQHGSRRKKLLKKLKKWVEGSENKHEGKCIGWVPEDHDDDDEEEVVPHRRSCSSF